MTASRREFNKQETVRHIRTVFLSLYAQGGIGAVSVNQLCQQCGIARSTFYLYFDDKFAVLESIEEELLADLRVICYDLRDCDLREVASGRPLQKATDTVRYLREHADVFRMLLGPNGDLRFTSKWRKDIMDSFADRFRAEVGGRRADMACTIFTSALVGLYTWYITELPDLSEREFSIILGNLLKYSLCDLHAFTESL